MKWKAYPEYKESGIEWLGRIPFHWETKALRWIFKTLNGSTPQSSKSEYWGGDIPWATPDDLGGMTGNKLEATQRLITKAGYESCGTSMAPTGSLILSTRAPIGHLAIVGRPMCTNQGCRSLVFRKNDETYYFYYQLLAARSELESWGQGSTFKELGRNKLESIPIIVPPVNEQRTIASFLDRETEHIDALIAKKDRQIELLQEKRAALISHVVTKGLNPNVKMKHSGIEWLGGIPGHWIVTCAKRVCRVFIPQRNKPELNPDAGLPWITMEEIASPVVERSHARRFVTTSAALEAGSKALPPISVIASCVGNFGVASINLEPVIINQQLQAYIPEQIDPWFLRYLIGTSRPYFDMVGTATTLCYVNQEGFGELPIILPSYFEQRSIVSFLDEATRRIDALAAKVRKSVDKLREYRAALISTAVTGKIDVRKEVS